MKAMKANQKKAMTIAGVVFLLVAIAFAVTGNYLLAMSDAVIGVALIVVASQAADEDAA